jgi:hypothetical protein
LRRRQRARCEIRDACSRSMAVDSVRGGDPGAARRSSRLGRFCE